MNPYRCLSDEELRNLELEFKSFLISNNILGEEWALLNKENPEKAKGLVELFSELVFDKIIDSSNFLILKRPQFIHIIKKNNDEIEGIWIKRKSELTNEIQITENMELNDNDFECYKGKKKTQNIKKDWFNFLELGYVKSDEILWNELIGFIK